MYQISLKSVKMTQKIMKSSMMPLTEVALEMFQIK